MQLFVYEIITCIAVLMNLQSVMDECTGAKLYMALEGCLCDTQAHVMAHGREPRHIGPTHELTCS